LHQLKDWLLGHGRKRCRSKAVGKMMLFQAPPSVTDSFHTSIRWFYAGRAYEKEEEPGNPSLSIISVANAPQKQLLCCVRGSQHTPPCVPLVTRILTRPY